MKRRTRHTPETAIVHAAFEVTQDLCVRLAHAVLFAGRCLLALSFVLGAACRLLVAFLWEQVHADDRRVLSAAVPTLREWCRALYGRLRETDLWLAERLRGVGPAVAHWLAYGLARVVVSLGEGSRRPRWHATRGELERRGGLRNAPALLAVPDDGRDDVDEIYTEYGDPVGRKAVAA